MQLRACNSKVCAHAAEWEALASSLFLVGRPARMGMPGLGFAPMVLPGWGGVGHGCGGIATAQSLVVLDEVGRGTGYMDGLALARSVLGVERHYTVPPPQKNHLRELLLNWGLALTCEATGVTCVHTRSPCLLLVYHVAPDVALFCDSHARSAILRFLHVEVGCRTLSATHFLPLPTLCAKLKGVAAYQLDVTYGSDGIEFYHKVQTCMCCTLPSLNQPHRNPRLAVYQRSPTNASLVASPHPSP